MSFDVPTIRFVQCGSGERVATATQGDGPLLVCPAWWVGHTERDFEIPEFRRFFSSLAKVARVVRYDRPGVGLSSAAKGPRNLEREVEILTDVIEAVGGERVSLLGISSGGPPAVEWAARHPERVEQLIACGVPERSALGDDPRGAVRLPAVAAFVGLVGRVRGKQRQMTR